MPGLQAKNELLHAESRTDRQEFDALTALKDPAHGRTCRRQVSLVRQHVLSFGQVVDKQAENYDQSACDNVLRLCGKDRGSLEQEIFEETKTTFDALLLLGKLKK
jgi:hypothetical protein